MLSLAVAFFCTSLQAQESGFHVVQADTISVDSLMSEHSPHKAAMYSAVLPGLGQIYNRKYWKLPLVYAGLGGFGYGAVWNSRQYRYYFDLYKFMTDNSYQEWEGRSIREVEWYKNAHLRYKNLMIILTVGFYALQIVDASVDAYLINFDISDDISLRVEPVMIEPVMTEPSFFNAAMNGPGTSSTGFGLRCCLSF
jgi:hypothetical protein